MCNKNSAQIFLIDKMKNSVLHVFRTTIDFVVFKNRMFIFIIVISRFSWFLEEPLSFALHCTKSLFGALMCTAQNSKVESAAMIRSMIHPGPGTRTGQFRDFKKREKWSGFKLRSPSAAIARTSCFEPPSPTQGQELLNSHSTVKYTSEESPLGHNNSPSGWPWHKRWAQSSKLKKWRT